MPLPFWHTVGVQADREPLLTPNSLYYDWSGMVLSSHLSDPVENVSTPRLEILNHASG